MSGADTRPARVAYEEASKVLVEARSLREYPWTPFYSSPFSEEGIALLEGHVPETYRGDRAPDVVANPRLVREYHLRDYVCGVVVEGLCVHWDLDFPPVHAVTWCLGWGLYEHSKKFEDALCGEIYTRSTRVPYDIYQGDELVDESLFANLRRKLGLLHHRVANCGRTNDIAT